jgi:hypothetical protein
MFSELTKSDDIRNPGSKAVEKHIYRLSLRCLSLIDNIVSISQLTDFKRLILFLTACQDPTDPWVLEDSASDAQKLLEKYRELILIPEILMDFILKRHLQPLFLKDRPSNISSAGRKLEQKPDSKHHLFADSHEKIWKIKKSPTLGILSWTIKNVPVCAPEKI